ncbi:hypothetical protein FOQG_19436 [Fusarium oxysporum f. sp. raphani 54005]|uniref:Uncharacterized protein n=1 Tax=Fusarium oxysporum f. sp. raphani 54005 TaxID=1089458 RepID=X0BBE3_FUSOX|nr:hypothetical protein FOQG_19436 [Fusarium oxysporum f. sp. raphani 54005]
MSKNEPHSHLSFNTETGLTFTLAVFLTLSSWALPLTNERIQEQMASSKRSLNCYQWRKTSRFQQQHEVSRIRIVSAQQRRNESKVARNRLACEHNLARISIRCRVQTQTQSPRNASSRVVWDCKLQVQQVSTSSQHQTSRTRISASPCHLRARPT